MPVPENIWKKLKTYVYTWILAHVGEEHRYLVQDTTEVGDIERLFENLRGSAESDPEQFVETVAKKIEKLELVKVDPGKYAHQLQHFCATQYDYYNSIVKSSANGISERQFVDIMIKKVALTMPSLKFHANISAGNGVRWDLAEFKRRIQIKVSDGEAVIEPDGHENLRRINEQRQAAEKQQLQQQAQRSNGGYGGGYSGGYDGGFSGGGMHIDNTSSGIGDYEINHILRGSGGAGHGNGIGATGYRDGPGPEYESPAKKRRTAPWQRGRDQRSYAAVSAMAGAQVGSGGGGSNGGDADGDEWIRAQVEAYERQLELPGLPQYNRTSYSD